MGEINVFNGYLDVLFKKTVIIPKKYN